MFNLHCTSIFSYSSVLVLTAVINLVCSYLDLSPERTNVNEPIMEELSKRRTESTKIQIYKP